jgi:glycosyltransferase involved in cell wall biosynthesis
VARVQALVAEHDLGARVTLTGALSQAALLDEYRRAETLVLTSREETAPQVIAQALACGLPVAAARAGGVPYMVRDRETALLFPPGDAAACGRCLVELHKDPALRARISETGRAQARERFHPDAVAAQTVAVYRQVLAR